MAIKSMILGALVSLAAASPLEAVAQRAQVIPGPGMPSLESLGLTNDDLYDPEFLTKHNIKIAAPPQALTKRQSAPPTCAFGTGTEGTYANANACANYLYSLGSAYCDIPAGINADLLCTAGDTEIVGENYYRLPDGVVADCNNVANGAYWVIDNCSACRRSTCLVEGNQFAAGTNDYAVYVGLYDGSIKRHNGGSAAISKKTGKPI